MNLLFPVSHFVVSKISLSHSFLHCDQSKYDMHAIKVSLEFVRVKDKR